MARVLGKPVLWLLCRHHIGEVHIKWAVKAIFKEKTTGPSKQLFKDLRQAWMPKYHQLVTAEGARDKFKTFPEDQLVIGSKLHQLYIRSKEFVSYALEHEIFPR